MASRLELHEELKSLCENVYFKPPSNMSYPAIKYELSDIYTRRANDALYLATNNYTVTVIDKNPESEIPMKILLKFQRVALNRVYKADNLMHYVFTLYY